MPEQLAIYVKTTLDGAISDTDTAIDLVDATGLPTESFRLVIQDAEDDETNREIVYVSSRSGNSLTLDDVTYRGADGTTAVAHGGGSFVAHVLTPDSLRGLPRSAPLAVAPVYVPGAAAANNTPTSVTFLIPINIPAHMFVQSLKVRVATAGTGTVRWGLFDYSEDPTNAKELVGGSGALNGTGWRTIAAGTEGTLIRAGGYALVVAFPASNVPVVFSSASVAAGQVRNKTTGAWGDPIDITGFSATSTAQPIMFLNGLLGQFGADPPSFSVSW